MPSLHQRLAGASPDGVTGAAVSTCISKAVGGLALVLRDAAPQVQCALSLRYSHPFPAYLPTAADDRHASSARSRCPIMSPRS